MVDEETEVIREMRFHRAIMQANLLTILGKLRKRITTCDISEQGIKDGQEGLNKHISDMGLIDLIEMVCDWKAYNVMYDLMPLKKATEMQIERFNLTSEQVWLINLIIKEIDK